MKKKLRDLTIGDMFNNGWINKADSLTDTIFKSHKKELQSFFLLPFWENPHDDERYWLTLEDLDQEIEVPE